MLVQIIKSLLKAPPGNQNITIDPQEAFEDALRAARYDDALGILNEAKSIAEPMKLALQAELEFHRKNDDLAMVLVTDALRLKPDLPEGHYVTSMLLHEQKQYEEALLHAQCAANTGKSPRFIGQLGLCLLSIGRLLPARDMLRKYLLLEPTSLVSWVNLGIVYARLGNYSEATRCFNKALEITPAHPLVIKNMGVLHDEMSVNPCADYVNAMGGGNDCIVCHDADLSGLELEFENNPTNISLGMDLFDGYVLEARTADAWDIINTLEAYYPDNADLLYKRGYLNYRLGALGSAEKSFNSALKIDCQHQDALASLAGLYSDIEDFERSLKLREKIYDLYPGPITKMQLAFALTNACYYERSLALSISIMGEDQRYAAALQGNIGVCHAYMGELDKAMEAFDAVLQRDPGNTALRFYRATVELLRGNYSAGWQEYKYRFMDAAEQVRLLPYPLWAGESLSGKTILILAEQGLGDQVMFASCLDELLKFAGVSVCLEVHTRLAKTFERSFPWAKVIASSQKKEMEWFDSKLNPDFYLPIGELPRYFRNAVPDFSGQAYLKSCPARELHWKSALSTGVSKPRVGLSWRGGTQKTRSRLRSLDLGDLMPLFEIESIDFVCLQYGEIQGELEVFSSTYGINMLYDPAAISDLDEFAALISSLDLVITVCNTTVHIAGGLGKEVWVLAPQVPEWRYGIEGDRMDWYGSSRVFRQNSDRGWGALIERVAQELLIWHGPHQRGINST